jgi:hypothetical protein
MQEFVGHARASQFDHVCMTEIAAANLHGSSGYAYETQVFIMYGCAALAA